LMAERQVLKPSSMPTEQSQRSNTATMTLAAGHDVML
jgi:hypothetical protein